MKLASPPPGEMALGVSSRTSLAWPKSEVIAVRVVLCRVGSGCLSINPYAISPSLIATLFSVSEFGLNQGGLRVGTVRRHGPAGGWAAFSAGRYATVTAVPLRLTISMLPCPPTVS
jgi:hypothetical protein